MESRFSSFSSTSTYSHLLYLNDRDRACYLSGTASPRARQESMSFFSMTTSRTSSDSERSAFSEVSTESTGHSSLHSSTIPGEKYAENHYPLITSINHSQSFIQSDALQNHFAFVVARQMVAIHNTIIRALNSSYNHALGIKPGTQRCKDFLKFNQLVFQMLEHHHEIEETFLFPAFEELLEQPGAMDDNVAGHESFKPGLQAFKNYIFHEEVAETFHGPQFRGIIATFAPDLIQHLHDEIPTLLNLQIKDSAKVRKIWMRAEKEAKRDVDLYTFGPFILGCQDRSFLLDGERIEGFPGMPWFVEALLRKWHAKRHAGVWEFLPSDLYGNRRVIVA